MFLHVSVILFTGGSAPLHVGIHPLDQRQAPNPGSRHPSGAVHAGRYGQQADGTHPTGMQSCICQKFPQDHRKPKQKQKLRVNVTRSIDVTSASVQPLKYSKGISTGISSKLKLWEFLVLAAKQTEVLPHHQL